MNLRDDFDRVVVINLKRRPDRLERLKLALKQCKWPFKQPEVFEAIDGQDSRPLAEWRFGPGTWGCLQSQRQVLQRALDDGVKSLLVLEDDVCFAENFAKRVAAFLRAVPDDWDQLMIGGQHMNFGAKPELVKRGVYRCFDCERMHCYAIRGEFMRRFCERLSGGGTFNGMAHCDWILGRDPELQASHKVYAPENFLAGQDGGFSNIFGAVTPKKFWNPPPRSLSVVNLHAPPDVVAGLRPYGFCTGRGLGVNGGHDAKLHELFSQTENAPQARLEKLFEWIKFMQWELATDPDYICTVAHPEATPELVHAASMWRVFEITATSVEDALKQLPPKLRKRAKKHAGFESQMSHAGSEQKDSRFPPPPDTPVQFSIVNLKANPAKMPEGFIKAVLSRGKIEGDFVTVGRSTLKEIRQEFPPLPPKPRPHEPTVTEMAANFTLAMAGWVKAGFKVVEREVYEKRHAICLACDYWDAKARGGLGLCKKCGCTRAKLWLAPSVCPLKPPKW